MDDLTPMNFIARIKAMDAGERGKLRLKRLLELICDYPDSVDDERSSFAADIDELRASVNQINQTVAINKNEIIALQTQNADYVTKNTMLRTELNLLKLHAKECREHRDRNPPQQAPPPTPDVATQTQIDELNKEMKAVQIELNSIQQYLRINNLEIVGLPEPNQGESEETLLINAINNLEGIDEPIRPEDIDISHPLNSNRKDEKSVHVVKFVSRKTKHMILSAKKKDENKQFQFRNRDVYINEHLSKNNRALFAAAQEKKRALSYKFCWTRGGTVNLRKTENSEIITISSMDDVRNLNQ